MKKRAGVAASHTSKRLKVLRTYLLRVALQEGTHLVAVHEVELTSNFLVAGARRTVVRSVASVRHEWWTIVVLGGVVHGYILMPAHFF